MSVKFTPTEATEAALIKATNLIVCGSCEDRREIDPSDVEDYQSFDDLWDNMPMMCCDDPVPNPKIRQSVPMFGIPDIDDDYHIEAYMSRPEAWEYDLDDDLLDAIDVLRG